MAAQDEVTCYFQSGVESLVDYPCDPDAAVSPCCRRYTDTAQTCLSNRLCLDEDGTLENRGCTDQDWESPECPRFCSGRLSVMTAGKLTIK